jgi:pyruvate dehydrogenase E2 component (dihydrolipoamide acetyltransferase)
MEEGTIVRWLNQDGEFVERGEDLVEIETDDRKSLQEIASETRELIVSAREATIGPAQIEGGTFTVSNLGMHGVTRFQAVINPPQAAILAVGSMREVPGLAAGALELRPVVTVSLSCDHRILDGAEAAQFLTRLRSLIEEPEPWCFETAG